MHQCQFHQAAVAAAGALELLSKTVNLGWTSAGLERQYVQAGRITPLAIMGRERSKSLPQLREQGFNDPIFDAAVWISFVAPAKLPPAVAQRLVHEIHAVLAQPDVAAAIVERSLEVMATKPEQFQANYRAEFDVITRKIRDIGIEPQ